MVETKVLLPVWETLGIAWEKVKGAKGSIWAAIGIITIISVALFILENAITKENHSLGVLISFIIRLIQYVIALGVVNIGLRRALDLPFSYQDVFAVLKDNKPVKLAGLYILEILIFLPGIIAIGAIFVAMGTGIIAKGVFDVSNVAVVLIILTGIFGGFALCVYLGIRIWLAAAFVLDQNLGPWNAIKKSFQVSSGNFWRLLGAALMQVVILLVSILPLFIGLIWTLPWAHICYGVIYRKLLPNAGIANPPSPPATD